MTELRRARALLLAALVLVAIGGCSTNPAGEGPARSARPCAAVFPIERCEAMLTLAAERLGVADDDVTSIAIAPDPTPRSDGILENRGGSAPIVVLATVDGSVRQVDMCMGLSTGPACSNEPSLTIATVIGAGYSDVPCAGAPPDGCASPVPSHEPAAIAAARPLRLERLVVPVPGVGRHEIRLGTATIPNGVLTVAQAELGDPWPDGLRFSSEGLRLEIRSLVPGRPAFMNIHEHGWYPGTEEVEVLLVFEARRAEPGATIEIRNLVVE